MHHVAIMKKEWNFINKIQNRTKTIESRWLMTRTKPWNSLNINDTIFFKNSGEMITLKAKIKDIMQIDLQDQSFEKIYHIYYKEMGIEEEEYKYFYKLFKMKKYYVLIFLKNSTLVKPFQIDKKGFGNQSAWIVVDNINYLKV